MAFNPTPWTTSPATSRPQHPFKFNDLKRRRVPARIRSSTSSSGMTRLSQTRQRPYSSLKSTIDDIVEVESADDMALRIELEKLSNGVISSAGGISSAAPQVGVVQAGEIQEVLSSPELLDPAAILEATIGINDENNDVTVGSLADIDIDSESFTSSSIMGASDYARRDVIEFIGEAESIIHQIEKISTEGEGDDSIVQEPALKQLDHSTNIPNPVTEYQSATHSNNQNSILSATPSVGKILKYTIPAIGIWLCSPVLSMIDTASVGLLSGTAQQAALNPAISVTDYGALIVAFMYTATTNLIAAAVQADKDDNVASSIDGQQKTKTTLITALKLALVVGSVFGVLLGASGKFLLKILIGNDALDPMVFASALRYVQIRSLGMPAMVVIGTAQSACLGMQDVKSPLYVLFAAAVVNFLGDMIMVPSKSPWFGGTAGAAWATVASQYAALLFFARWLTTSVKDQGTKRNQDNGQTKLDTFLREEDINENANVVNVTQGIMDLTGTSKAGHSRRKQFRKFLASSKISRRIRRAGSLYPTVMAVDTTNSLDDKNIIRPTAGQKKNKSPPPVTQGFLANGQMSLRKYLSISNFNLDKAKEFLPFVVPVTTTSVGRISGYIAMSHVASSTLGTYDMAGHQIILSIFCCLTPIVDALSQVAQSLVPAIFESKENTTERAMALRKTVNNFRKVGAGFGGLLVALVACIPLLSRFFTSDAMVLERVNGAIPGAGLFLLVNGLMCSGEGSMLGQKDLAFLRNMYAVFFFTVPACMLRVKYRALAGLETVGIGSMWSIFAVYNVIRTAIWHARLYQLQRRTDRGVVPLR